MRLACGVHVLLISPVAPCPSPPQIREKLDEAQKELEAMRGSVVATESDAQMRLQQLATKVWEVGLCGLDMQPTGVGKQEAAWLESDVKRAMRQQAQQQGGGWRTFVWVCALCCFPLDPRLPCRSWRWGCCGCGRGSTRVCLQAKTP